MEITFLKALIKSPKFFSLAILENIEILFFSFSKCFLSYSFISSKSIKFGTEKILFDGNSIVKSSFSEGVNATMASKSLTFSKAAIFLIGLFLS